MLGALVTSYTDGVKATAKNVLVEVNVRADSVKFCRLWGLQGARMVAWGSTKRIREVTVRPEGLARE
jgi:hypothetical protein